MEQWQILVDIWATIRQNAIVSFLLSLIPTATVLASVFRWVTQKNRLRQYIFEQLNIDTERFKDYKKELNRYIPHNFVFGQKIIGYPALLREIKNKKQPQKYIFLFGKAGVGKSVLTKRLALDLRNKFSYKKDDSDLNIVYFRLTGKLTVEEITGQIKEKLHNRRGKKPIVIMDGFDEINLLGSKSADVALKEICTVLNKLSGKFEKFIISSRPEIFSAGRQIVEEISFDADRNFSIYTVRDFTPAQSISLYKALPLPHDDKKRDKKRKVKRFEKLVKENGDTVFSVPFVVTQADALFETYEDEQIIELGKTRNQYRLYQSIVDYALKKERDILLSPLVDENVKDKIRAVFGPQGTRVLREIAQLMVENNRPAVCKNEVDTIVERMYNENRAVFASIFPEANNCRESFLTRFLMVQKNDGTEYEFIHHTIFELFVGSEYIDAIQDRRKKAKLLTEYKANKSSIVYPVFCGKRHETYKACVKSKKIIPTANGSLTHTQFLRLVDKENTELVFYRLPAGVTLEQLAMDFPCARAITIEEAAGICVDESDKSLCDGILTLECGKGARLKPLLPYMDAEKIKEVIFNDAVVEDPEQLENFSNLERLDLGCRFGGDAVALCRPFKLTRLAVPCAGPGGEKAAFIQALLECTEKLCLYIMNFSPWYEVIHSLKKEQTLKDRICTANISDVNRYSESPAWTGVDSDRLQAVFALDCEYIANYGLSKAVLQKFQDRWVEFFEKKACGLDDGNSNAIPAAEKAQILRLLSELYATQTAFFGEQESATLRMEHWLGCAYYERGEEGDYAQAIAILSDVYEKRKEQHGEKHSDTLRTGDWLGCAYCERGEEGDYAQAIVILSDVYEKRKEQHGEKHSNTLNTGDWLGQSYSKRGNYTQAIAILSDVYEKRKEEQHGEKHSNTLNTGDWLGYSYYRRGEEGDSTQAAAILCDVYEKYKEAFAEKDSGTLYSGYWLAKTYQKRQDDAAAASVIAEVYAMLQVCTIDMGKMREDISELYDSLHPQAQ